MRRARLQWLGLCLVLLGFGGLLGALLYTEHEKTGEFEQDRLQVQARVISDGLGRQLDGINSALLGVRAELPPGWQGRDLHASVSNRLRALSEAMPGVRTLRLIDANGIVWAANWNEMIGADRSQREFFKTILARPDPEILYVSTPFLSARGVITLTVSRAVVDLRGEFAGLVSATLDPDYFSVVMRSVIYAPDMLATLTSHDGQPFLTVSQDARAPKAAAGQGAAGAPPLTQGNERLGVGRTLESSRTQMSQPLVVTVSRARAAIYKPWREHLWLYMALYALVALIAGLSLYVLQRRRVLLDRLGLEREKERQESLERLELALGSADMGLWDRNFATNVRAYNERWCTMLGHTREEIDTSGITWQDLVHPGDLLAASEALGQHIRGEVPLYESEHRMRRKDGRWIWVQARGKVVARDEAGMPVRMVGTHMDITERKRAEAVLRESETRFRSLTELSSDWYWEQDEQFRFVRIDGRVEVPAAFGLHPDIGLTRWDVPAANMSEADWVAHRAVLYAHEVFRDLELERRTPEGELVWTSTSGAPFFDENGVFRGYRGVGRNINERKRAEQEIERLAFYDGLTSLPNRRLLTDRLQKALTACGRSQGHGALLFIDLDNFKDLNDTRGHDVGDLLLRQVATRLRQCVREADTVARLGGDEFVVMLEDLSQAEGDAAAQAASVGQKILAAINQPFDLLGQQHHSTPSIGITLFHDPLQGVDELLKRADLAMYQAKAAGRNTQRFFDPGMQAQASARAALEGDLRQGLQRAELVLHYQPVVDETGRVTGVEALVRWQHPQRGMVMPGEFIPVAEQAGLIIPLGQWVLETACAQLVAWHSQPATSHLSIAVNVSARQFRQPDFGDQVMALLMKTGANPARLKLELTESLLLSDVEDAISKMSELRAIGVGFALDDFGTGYSSLSYLKRLPLDQLKIDQSFVRDVLTDPNDAAIVRTILALARSMDLAVVAEGVETAVQREFLLSHGCTAFQGYLFGRPVPVHELRLAPAMV